MATNYGRDISDTLEFTLRTSDGAVAAKTQLETAGLPDGSVWTAKFADCQPVQEGEQLTLEIASLFGYARRRGVHLLRGYGFRGKI